MIEFCTKKRMLLAIALLGGLTLLALILESHLTSGGNGHNKTQKDLLNSTFCWTREEYTIVQECQPCSEFDIKNKITPSCAETNFRELVNCEKSGQVYRSCKKVRWLEERNFWLLETLMLTVAFLSSGIVSVRRRQLEGQVLRRIEQQLASGV